MKSFTGNSSPVRGWALLLALLLGAGMMISACGEEEVPAPTTPTPPPAPPPPAPAPEPAPEPAGPATPTGLRASPGEGYIEWTWDAVEGVLGYQGQFSTDATFTDADTSFLIAAPKTSQRVNATSGYFRVRSGVGTSLTDFASLQFSDWSEAVSGTAPAAPTPTPTTTPLSVPGNVRTTTRRDTSITVAWDSVTDAEAYDVQQQAAGDASWSSASCGGAGNRVTATECVASGLDSGTAYGFRVRAVPDSADTDSAPSQYSSAVTANTTGRPAVMIEDGGLNLRWSSEWDTSTATDAYAITWRWDPVEDRALQPLVDHYVALLSPINADGTARPLGERECPSLDRNVTATDTVTDTAANYGDWFNLDSDISATVRPVGSAADGSAPGNAGEVRGLCVVRTWEDSRGIRQFSDVSLSWATTLPSSPVGDGTNPINRENAVTRATTSINWQYDVDAGFTYALGLLSTSRDSDAPDDVADCTGAQNVPSPREVNTHDFRVSHRLQSVAPYTNYRLCIRAENELGASDWAFVGGAAASGPPTYAGATAASRPAAPSAPAYDSGESEVTTEAYGGHDVNRMVWSVSHKTGTPLNGTAPTTTRGGHVYKVLRRSTGGSISGSAIQTTCESGTDIGASPSTLAARNFGDGFEIQLEGDIVSDTAVGSTPGAYYIYACVRADPSDGADDHGPWSISSPRVFAAGIPIAVTGVAGTTGTGARQTSWSWDAMSGATGYTLEFLDGTTVLGTRTVGATIGRATSPYVFTAPSNIAGGTTITLNIRQYQTHAGARLLGATGGTSSASTPN